MPDPIVFISRHRIKPGKLDGFSQLMRRNLAMVEAGKPMTAALLAYVDEDGREMIVVHAFADPDSFDAHLEGSGERSQPAYEFIEPQSFSIYGPASDWALNFMRQEASEVAADLDLKPEYLTGFLRLKSSS
jgi:hypothetical protein